MSRFYDTKAKFFLLSFLTILAITMNLSAKEIPADIIDGVFGWAGGGISPSVLI